MPCHAVSVLAVISIVTQRYDKALRDGPFEGDNIPLSFLVVGVVCAVTPSLDKRK